LEKKTGAKQLLTEWIRLAEDTGGYFYRENNITEIIMGRNPVIEIPNDRCA